MFALASALVSFLRHKRRTLKFNKQRNGSCVERYSKAQYFNERAHTVIVNSLEIDEDYKAEQKVKILIETKYTVLIVKSLFI